MRWLSRKGGTSEKSSKATMFANINQKDSFFAEAVHFAIEVTYSKQLEIRKKELFDLVNQIQNKIVNSSQLQAIIQRKESSQKLAEKLKKVVKEVYGSLPCAL